ncbi:MFS transporter [Cellulomonas cellasea]|uniref:MFS family permease n=1 Tax=Cellulomonas cellasea TaxID=43670 RepID=A0A7W4YAC0_9CELL|nr:MFS transporter [Cellulomonas cellasea]MBB2921251.1 MFS family permease [Cellulomonas cellasea]
MSVIESIPAALDIDAPEQRRVLRVLVLAQVLSGAGLAAGITVGALLAEDLLGSTALAGIPSALFAAGSAAAAWLVGRLSQRAGRRAGLAAGYYAGAAGSAGVVLAAVTSSVPLLLLSLLVYGAGSATNLQARYAGADLAAPAHRGRAVSTVLVATTLGAVAGPNLVAVTGTVATGWGIPALAGPFMLAGAAYATAGTVLTLLLRPDPLLLARERQRVTDAATPVVPARRGARTGVLRAAGVMVLTQLVMTAVMTMTPVHMQAHHHAANAMGLVIAIHVGCMFLPAPLSGALVDRLGPAPVAGLAGTVLLGAGITAGLAPGESFVHLAVALGLLGLGWSLGLVSGTAMLASALPLEVRARTQGSVDVAVAIAGTVAGLGSGLMMSAGGFPILALVSGALGLVVVSVSARTPRGGHDT